MVLKQIMLQHFRSYEQSHFRFDPHITLIVGPNTAGKTNLIEALFLLATGKSFRTDKDVQMIAFAEDIARVKGKVLLSDEDERTLEVVIARQSGEGVRSFLKKYLVNEVAKRRVDFTGILKVVLFTPLDLELISGGPAQRRGFLDSMLEQIDLDYRHSLTQYTRALRQRNALLEQAQETGIRNERLFEYWNELLIRQGTVISQKREDFVAFVNSMPKELTQFSAVYDASRISEERLAQYAQAEIGAGVTLVGPHRDDVLFYLPETEGGEDVRFFASRGQQRLVVLQLKLLQLSYMEHAMGGERPVLLLDDIFSELDASHIHHVMQLVTKQQTILTTTHKEFVEHEALKDIHMVELKQA